MNKKHIKSFNGVTENLNIHDKINETSDVNDVNDVNDDIRVKDLINFLQKLNPEIPVYLEHDDWPNKNSYIKSHRNLSIDDRIRYLMDDSSKNALHINN